MSRKENSRINLFCISLAVLALAACAGAPRGAAAPAWVTDLEAAYPDSAWLRAAETGPDRTAAGALALQTIAQAFRVDVQAVTRAALVLESRESAASSAGGARGAGAAASSAARRIAQDVTAASAVSGLIGAEQEFWTDPATGLAHALIRMNRAACAARYAAIVDENERAVAALLEQADAEAGRFTAVAALRRAQPLAELTDNFLTILSVLDPSRGSRRTAYGGAAAVADRSRRAIAGIVIAVRVDGDIDGRVAGAFTAFFTAQGFRAADSGQNALEARFALEDQSQSGADRSYVRFTLSAELRDHDGKRLFAWQDTGREGHTDLAGAADRALRAVEALIVATDFAGSFTEWLDGI